MKQLLYLSLALIILASCGPKPVTSIPVPTISPTSSPTSTPQASTSSDNWWNTAVFYEIFVRSFYDSDGDGIGDFNGITEKLDYLKDLGISAVWLMPIQPSPTYHGYDVINYFNVNPAYGTMADFKRLLSEAHKRNIRVIIDLVLNHTSSQSPWFVDANNDPQSPFRDWYIWTDTDSGGSGPNGNLWHPGLHGYYYGVFGDSMPDLNYKNPAVTAMMQKIVQFWLNNVGVDGFRLDAVKYLIEEGQKIENTASTHDWLKGFYTSYKADKSYAFTVGEVYGAGAFIAKTYTGDQMDEIFNFELASGFVNSAAGGASSGVQSAIKFTLKDMPQGPYATFLTNHDQNRVMSVLSGSFEKAKLAAFLLLTSPGTPFIYYGEEIGMQGEKPDEFIRRPMQWNSGQNAGFTSGTPWEDLGDNVNAANTAAELADSNSLLNFYRTLIALRAAHPALSGTGLALVSAGNPGVYAAIRSGGGETILVLSNLSKTPISDYRLDIKGLSLPDGSYHLRSLLQPLDTSDLKVNAGSFSAYQPVPQLPPFSRYIFVIQIQ